MIGIKSLAELCNKDLANVREELKECSDILSKKLGCPTAFFAADQKSAVYLVPEGFVVADYSMDEDDITLENIKFHTSLGAEDRRERISNMIESCLTQNEDKAKDILSELVSETIRIVHAQREVSSRMSDVEKYLKETAEAVPESSNSVFIPKSNGFNRENFPIVESLESINDRINELIKENAEEEEDMVEASYVSGRGGKIHRVKINRKARRLMKKLSRKNRSRLIRQLRKARKSLRKKMRSSSFRKKIARVRHMNDACDPEGIRECIKEIVRNWPEIGLVTTNEMETLVDEALRLEGVENPEQDVVEETAEALVRLARHYFPEAKRDIVQAALAYLPPSADMPGADLDEAIESVAYQLYEEMDSRDNDAIEAVNDTLDCIQSLIKDIEAEFGDSEGQDADDARLIKDNLEGFAVTLQGFVEDPETISLERLSTIVNQVADMFGDEDDDDDGGKDSGKDSEDEDESDDSEDPKDPEKEDSEEESEGEESEESEDEESEDNVDESNANNSWVQFSIGNLKEGTQFKFESTESRPGALAGQVYTKAEDDRYVNEDTGIKFSIANESEIVLVDPEFISNDDAEDTVDESKIDENIEKSEEALKENEELVVVEGFSYTRVAGDVLKELVKALKERGDADGTNTWSFKGREYFEETDTSAKQDGSISGEIMSFPQGETEKGSRLEGKFKISAEGKVLRFPSATKEIIAKAESKAKTGSTEKKKYDYLKEALKDGEFISDSDDVYESLTSEGGVAYSEKLNVLLVHSQGDQYCAFEGMTQEAIREVAIDDLTPEELQEEISPLRMLEAACASIGRGVDTLNEKFDLEGQEEVSSYLLSKIGFEQDPK